MKGGIVYSNFVTTVSPGYAWEVCNSDEGLGLGRTLGVHRRKFDGMLNGVDYDVWNPEIDPLIPRCYGPDRWRRNTRTKAPAPAVQAARRAQARGLVRRAAGSPERCGPHSPRDPYAVRHGAQFVLLGSAPEPSIGGHFRHLKDHYNDSPDVHLELSSAPTSHISCTQGPTCW